MDITTPNHADIIRRVEKIEIDVAVLDSKSNRLHQDMKESLVKMDQMQKEHRESMEHLREDNQQTQHIARKTQTLVVAVPAIIAGMWTLIQIIENVAHK